MRYRRSVSAAATGTAIASVLAFASGIAGAHGVDFDGKVTIKTDPSFHGRVISEKAACEKQRKVRIYREQSGPDGLYTKTTTGDDGRWEHLVSQLTGDFYAKIRRSDIGSAGHEHVCQSDRSKSVHVQAPPP